MSKQDYQYVAPRQAGAEPVCLLDRETAARRHEPPSRLLAEAASQSTDDSGATFLFEDGDQMWDRLAVFIEEEGACCPFFAFERWLEDGRAVLRIIGPKETIDV